ncbi:DUF5640 domain-containing protein [Bacillus alkalisoli]|uniref:DUF5640 domain-containing protein n=1 Tax=Bacillus alkalisoli TaxID=2011008 RepID=UPI000C23AE50|nr:DUF5640 domain-containing protein [Bacillus alkalisoli]
MRFHKLLLASIFTLVLLAGCSSDSSKVVGEWVDQFGVMTFEFKKDGAYTLDSGYGGNEGTYEVDGKNLTLNFNDQTLKFAYNFNGDKLELKGEGDVQPIVLTKVE